MKDNAPERLKQAITDFAAGNDRERNFQLIFQHFYAVVLNFFRQKIIDLERSKELTQETFLRVYKNIGAARLAQNDSFASWLFTIARNLLMDEFRRKRGGKEISLDGGSENADGSITAINPPDNSPAADVEGQAMKNEFRRKLANAIGKLSEMQRKCLTLHVYQEKTASEIALLLRLKEGTVKAHLHQAKENLKKILATAV